MPVKRVILAAALVVLLLGSSIFSASCDFIPRELVPEGFASKNEVSDLPPEFDILADIWKLLSQNYVDKDKLDLWIGKGAIPTDTVAQLCKGRGLM